MQNTYLFSVSSGCGDSVLHRIKVILLKLGSSIRNFVSTLKQHGILKYASYLLVSGLLVTAAVLASPETTTVFGFAAETETRSSISGYVFDQQNKPIQDVFITILEDSTVKTKTDARGFYTISLGSEGEYTLCLTHQDYVEDTMLFDLDEGVDDILEPIRLSYAWYVFAGKVICKGKPVSGAGVAVAGYPVSTTTDAMGNYVLDRAPKESALKLVYAKTGAGSNTFRPMRVNTKDTIWVHDIELIDNSVTVSKSDSDSKVKSALPPVSSIQSLSDVIISGNVMLKKSNS